MFFSDEVLEGGTVFEIHHQSQVEKSQFLNFLISELLVYKSMSELDQDDPTPPPEILYFENATRLDLEGL
jgi:hypothetical protein